MEKIRIELNSVNSNKEPRKFVFTHDGKRYETLTLVTRELTLQDRFIAREIKAIIMDLISDARKNSTQTDIEPKKETKTEFTAEDRKQFFSIILNGAGSPNLLKKLEKIILDNNLVLWELGSNPGVDLATTIRADQEIKDKDRVRFEIEDMDLVLLNVMVGFSPL